MTWSRRPSWRAHPARPKKHSAEDGSTQGPSLSREPLEKVLERDSFPCDDVSTIRTRGMDLHGTSVNRQDQTKTPGRPVSGLRTFRTDITFAHQFVMPSTPPSRPVTPRPPYHDNMLDVLLIDRSCWQSEPLIHTESYHRTLP